VSYAIFWRLKKNKPHEIRPREQKLHGVTLTFKVIVCPNIKKIKCLSLYDLVYYVKRMKKYLEIYFFESQRAPML